MKKYTWLGVLSVIILAGVSLTMMNLEENSSEMRLLPPDGPDKAILRDYWMMHDPSTGMVPLEKLKSLKEIPTGARTESHRDFQWQNYDTGRPGRGRFILHEPQSGALFTGSVSGGLYVNNTYSTDGGVWEKVESFPDISVSCLAADPTNPDLLYVGTGESFTAFINYRESTGIGNGLYYSMDRGQSWNHIPSTEEFEFINDLVIREENGVGVIYAAVGSGSYKSRTFIQEGLYRSSDQGNTWSQVLPLADGNSTYQVSDLELTSNNTLFAGTMRNGSDNWFGGQVLSSGDGLNWTVNTQIFNDLVPLGGFPGRTIVKSSPQNPDHLYVLATNGYYNGLEQLRDYEVYLYQSIDGGSSWSSLPLPEEQWANIPWHALSLAIDPSDENRIVIGALNMYILNNTSAVPAVEEPWVALSRWFAMYNLQGDISPEDREYWESVYIHGDIHDIQFYNNDPDHILISTDGGIFGTTNLTAIHTYDYEVPSEGIVKFNQVGSGLNTTQYYAVDLHPYKGIYNFLGGTQDNGSISVEGAESVVDESWISGGDGGFAFFDSDNTNLRITSVYGNRWYFHINDETFYTPWVDGLFVNPADYDDESNLLYTNPSTSPNGGLYWELRGRYYDSLRIINVNKYLLTSDLGLDTTFYVPLNTGIQEAITAIEISPYGNKMDRTLFFGTEYGKVFRVDGLPNNPVTKRIDNEYINQGYVSSIAVGESANSLLVTLSNFGINSVYVSGNGGENWLNIDRNLPDMPIRWGVFNPFDNLKVLIATEMGVWGLENYADLAEEWHGYNGDMPEIRVDMIKVRASDSTILAGTHGAGLWWGKIDQGEAVPLSVGDPEPSGSNLYPNPFRDIVKSGITGINTLEVYDLAGKSHGTFQGPGEYDLSVLPTGYYVINSISADGTTFSSDKMIKID